MLKNCIVAAVLLTIGLANYSTTTRNTSAGVQQKYPPLTAGQRAAIQLLISTNASPSGYTSSVDLTTKETFRTGEPVHIGIVITNSANDAATVCAFSNPYYQNRPQLKRNGQILRYEDKLIELVRQSDLGQLCEIFRSPDMVILKPKVPLRLPSIELHEWYGVIPQGHYEFTLNRTFACCADGNSNASNTISFEVSP
jgi:hypothetical protein